MNHKRLKIIFISMNRFGQECLSEILENGVAVDYIFTINEDRAPRISDYTDFSRIASEHCIPLKRVRNINDELDFIRDLKPDLVFVLGWSQIIGKDLLLIPRLGCIGSHPALLPKNRGRAAIPWHFINKEQYGGITFFYLDEGCDSGDIIAQKRFLIEDSDNAGTYYGKICSLGRECIREQLADILDGTVQRKKQDNELSTYLLIRGPEDSRIDFRKPSREIFNLIRAVAYMYPAAFAFYAGCKVLAHKSILVSGELYKYPALPGQILEIGEDCMRVKTGDGVIELMELFSEDGGKIKPKKLFAVGGILD